MKKLTLLTIFCVMFLCAGCIGDIIAEFRGISISSFSSLQEAQPLKIGKHEVQNIRTICVSPVIDEPTKPFLTDNRFYDEIPKFIVSELSKSRRWKIITPFQYINKVGEPPGGGLTELDKAGYYKKICSELKTDAILVSEIGSKEAKWGSAFEGVLISGKILISVDVLLILRSFTGEAIWYQKYSILYSCGKGSSKVMTDPEIVKLADDTIKALIVNFINTFL